jgi:hypothetical protein
MEQSASGVRGFISVIGAIGLLCIWAFFTPLLIRKLVRPDYLIIHESGRVLWSPFFTMRGFDYAPEATWQVKDGHVRFNSSIKPSGAPDNIQIPNGAVFLEPEGTKS